MTRGELEVALEALDRLVHAEREGDQKALKVAQEAADRALVLAAEANTLSAEKANELRNVISDALGSFATRDYVDGLVRPLEKASDRGAGGVLSRDKLIAWFIAGASVVIAVVVLLTN